MFLSRFKHLLNKAGAFFIRYNIINSCNFNCKVVEKIDFRKDFGIALFSPQDKASLFEVILEYDITNEFFLTDKIDAKFFHRISSS